jgi:hypothetical protein
LVEVRAAAKLAMQVEKMMGIETCGTRMAETLEDREMLSPTVVVPWPNPLLDVPHHHPSLLPLEQ